MTQWIEKYIPKIKQFEGYTPNAAWDYKQYSVGYGTRAKHPGEVIDQAEADRRLRSELLNAAAIVDRVAPYLDPGTKAALTSLTYNAGEAWTNSGLGAAVRSGNKSEIARILQQYNKAGGQSLPGLVNRRKEEASWITGGGPVAEVRQIPTPAVQNALISPKTPQPVQQPQAPAMNALISSRTEPAPQTNAWADIGNALLSMQQPRRAPNMQLGSLAMGGRMRGMLPGGFG